MDDLQTLATALAPTELSPDAVDRGRHRLRLRMGGPVRRRRAGWPAAGLGLTAAAATAAIVVASGSTAPTATPNSPPVAAQPSGRQFLLAAAAVAERTPVGAGTYWHVRTVFRAREDGGPSGWESWTRRDGHSWFRGEKSNGQVVELARSSPFRLGGSSVSFEQLQKLPTRPEALKGWIAESIEHGDVRTSAGRPDAAMRKRFVFSGLVSLISQLPAPPKVRAAAFRAIASDPYVKSLGKVRGGQGLLIPLAGSEVRLVVDPATSRVRDTNSFVTADGAEVRTEATGSATILAEWTDVRPD